MEVVVVEFKAASPNLPAMTEKDHENTSQVACLMAENRTWNLHKHEAGLLTISLCSVRAYQTNLETMVSINQTLVTRQPSKTFRTSIPLVMLSDTLTLASATRWRPDDV